MNEALAPTRHRTYARRFSSKQGAWTEEEDEKLRQYMISGQQVCWSHLAKEFPNRTAQQLAGRWEKVLDPGIIKGSWTMEEDRAIVEFVDKYGIKAWAKLARLLPGRTGKQCRERFKNQLSPKVSKAPWTPEEDQKLISLHKTWGNAWTKLATFFDGRTDNCVKNRWNSTLSKREYRESHGQPLTMKRGRKPKETDPNSSPGMLLPTPELGIISVPPVLSFPSPTRITRSLDENRLELERALSV